MARWLVIAAVTATGCGAKAAGRDGTTITITDKVLVSGTVRFGINLGGDAYYSGAALVKKRAVENFEGTTYRQCHFGPLNDSRGATTWFGLNDSWKEMMLREGRHTILAGPAKGITGRKVAADVKQDGACVTLTLAHPVEVERGQAIEVTFGP